MKIEKGKFSWNSFRIVFRHAVDLAETWSKLTMRSNFVFLFSLFCILLKRDPQKLSEYIYRTMGMFDIVLQIVSTYRRKLVSLLRVATNLPPLLFNMENCIIVNTVAKRNHEFSSNIVKAWKLQFSWFFNLLKIIC